MNEWRETERDRDGVYLVTPRVFSRIKLRQQ